MGPEAGLTGVIAGLCYWVGDNIRYAKQDVAVFSEIGEAVTLGQLFHSPLFGILEVEEGNAADREKQELSKSSKFLFYGIAMAASILAAETLSFFFGKGMEGFPCFSEAPVERADYLLLIVYILAGLLIYIVFEAFEKCIGFLAGRMPAIIKETLCGAAIGIMALMFPMVMFSGEEQMAEMIDSFTGYGPAILIGICFIKLLMTVFCIRFGMKGGHFFPLIFACTCMGIALSQIFFAEPAAHAAFAAAAVTATVLGAQLKKPLAASLLLLLCFPLKILIWIFVCAATGAAVIGLPGRHRSF